MCRCSNVIMNCRVIILAVLCCLLSVGLQSCGNGPQGRNADAEQSRQASAVRDSLPEADSLAKVNFSSPDLTTFWLRGRVKSMVETTESGYTVTLKFDEKGNLLSHSAYSGRNSKILRDANDRIISMVNLVGDADRNNGEDFSYDADGRVSNLSHWSQSHDTYQIVEYSKEGWPLKANLADCDDDYSGRVTFKYPKTDVYGNWIRQVASETWPDIAETTYVTTRVITYYE